MTRHPLCKILGLGLLAVADVTSVDPNSYGSVGWVLLSIGAILFILNQGADFIARFRGKTAKGDDAPVSRREWHERNEKLDTAMDSLTADVKELLQRTAHAAGYRNR